jgi:hypothetical protein
VGELWVWIICPLSEGEYTVILYNVLSDADTEVSTEHNKNICLSQKI